MTDDDVDARPRGALARLLAPVARWARKKSMVGIAIVGALPPILQGRDALAFSEPRALPIGIPTDAPTARQADVLVVVGAISHKLAPFLLRAHASMAQPARVLVVDLQPPLSAEQGRTLPPPSLRGMRSYATAAAIEELLPVDVVVRGAPPSAAAMERAVAALFAGERPTSATTPESR